MGDMLPDPNSIKTHSWSIWVFFPDTLHFASHKNEVQPYHTGQANAPPKSCAQALTAMLE